MWGPNLIKKNFKIVRIFSRLNIGGPSYHVINLADRMQDYYFETTLVVGQTSNWEGNLISYAQTKKIQPVVLKCFSAAISPVNDLISFFKIFILLIKVKPDIVHTHTFKAGFIGRLAAFCALVPIRVHTYHGHLINNYWAGWKLWILKTIEKNLSRITDACIGVSPQVGADLIKAGVISASKMKTVSLGFDFSYLNDEIQAPSTIRKGLNIPQGDFVFGTACRLVPIKNISLLIESSVDILKEHKNSHLVIVGQGPEKKLLLEQANLLTAANETLLDRMHFLDWIIPFQRELKDFDFYVCCSKNEGTSVSVIEALIAEVPVVSTAVGGMPDLLNHGAYGELIPPGSAIDLTNSIRKEIASHHISKSQEKCEKLKSISQKITALYNEKTLAENTYAIYKDILIKKGLFKE